MSENLEQCMYIKFCHKIGKITIEIYQMLSIGCMKFSLDSAHSNKSIPICFIFLFLFSKSSFGINLTATLCMPKSNVKIV